MSRGVVFGGQFVDNIVKLEKSMKVYQCMICGYLYNEVKGDPDSGLAPGTKWEDVPEDWICPDCAAMKDDFVMVEV